MYPAGMFSCIAGFIDHGESLEDAIRREAAEEVGICLDDVKVEDSQHWAFPMGKKRFDILRTRGEASLLHLFPSFVPNPSTECRNANF